MLYVLYHAPETRIVFTAFFFVALMFGMLRHSGTMLALLGCISFASFAFVIGLRFANNGDAEVLRVDLLQFLVMVITFPGFVFIGGRVKRLQRGLNEASIKLEDIEDKARHDDLTGVYNRRALLVAMEESKRLAELAGEPLSICVIDIDLFKRYNDEFDHLTGDQVLRAFAQAVRWTARRPTSLGAMAARSSSRSSDTPRWRERWPMPSGCASALALGYSDRAVDRSSNRIDRRGAIQARGNDHADLRPSR
jgi:predicted signal transduction protein with EAL and GGDEF domain